MTSAAVGFEPISFVNITDALSVDENFIYDDNLPYESQNVFFFFEWHLDAIWNLLWKRTYL